jgi:hypothetical protein
MAVSFFYTQDNTQFGPVSADGLKRLAASGELQPTALIWREGMAEWQPANRVKGLFSQVPPAYANSPSAQYSSESNGGAEADSFAALRDVSAQAAKAGLNEARKLGRRGKAQLKQHFGAALGTTVGRATNSLGQLLKHPVALAFYTIVLFIASALAVGGLLTSLLVPVFVIGYVTVMQKLLKGEEASLKEFLSFMRHGWDSIWHLTMLFAAFVVTLASILAPFVIVAIILYVTAGSLGAGVGQIASWSSSGSNARPHISSRETWDEAVTLPSREGDGWIARMLAKIVWLFTEGLTVIISTMVMTPLAIAIMMCYLLALDMSSDTVATDRKYDFVFDAYGRMLTTARQHWKELLVGGLFLALLWNALFFGMTALGRIVVGMGANVLGVWIAVGLMPISMTLYVIYANVFLTWSSLEICSIGSVPENGQTIAT